MGFFEVNSIFILKDFKHASSELRASYHQTKNGDGLTYKVDTDNTKQQFVLYQRGYIFHLKICKVKKYCVTFQFDMT